MHADGPCQQFTHNSTPSSGRPRLANIQLVPYAKALEHVAARDACDPFPSGGQSSASKQGRHTYEIIKPSPTIIHACAKPGQ